jgi:Ca2+-binding RTX toxin-like protein
MILATALMTMFALVVPLAGDGIADTPDNTFVLNVEPEQSVNEPGVTHNLTATILNSDGCQDPGDAQCQIDFEIEGTSGDGTTHDSPDFECTIPQGATQCGVGYTSANPQTDKIRVWVDDDNNNNTFDGDATEGRNKFRQPGETPEDDDTDVVEKTWAVPDQVTAVDAEPESSERKVGSDHTITCVLRDGFGSPVAGAECATEVASGINADNNIDNDPLTPLGFMGHCTTDDAGTCTVTYTSPDPGTDTVRVFFDENGSDTSNGGEPRDPNDTIVNWTTDITAGPCAGLNYNTRKNKSGGGQIIAGSPGPNTISGTPGPDTVCAFAGNDNVKGLRGNDRVLAGIGSDKVDGAAGIDTLEGSGGQDLLAGGDGIDTIVAGGQNDNLIGGAGNDIIRGQDGTDALRGRGGADTLEGGTHADIIFGHGGNDMLKGGGGNDELDGGLGKDTCTSGPGRDQVRRCE